MTHTVTIACLFALFVLTVNTVAQRNYIEYDSPLKWEKKQGVKIREYRRGVNKGRVEKINPDGSINIWNPGKADYKATDPNNDTILKHQNITLLESWKIQNDWEKTDLLSRLVKNTENKSKTVMFEKKSAEPLSYKASYCDGFTAANSLIIIILPRI